MKSTLIFAALVVVAASHAQQIPVSVYDFNGTLNESFDRDNRAEALEFRAGRSGSTVVPPTYSLETVGNVTKPVANFDDTLNQEKFFRARHGMAPNGGSTTYVNQYSILMDLKLTSVEDWVSLYNTTADNGNDGDLFVRNTDSGLGISGDYAGTFTRNQWNRLVVTVDTAQGATPSMNIYLNGLWVNQVALNSGFDGRWAAFAYNDPTNVRWIDVLGDNSGESGAGQISQLAFYDRVLTASEVSDLGPVSGAVPEPATLAALGLGLAAVLRRRKK